MSTSLASYGYSTTIEFSEGPVTVTVVTQTQGDHYEQILYRGSIINLPTPPPPRLIGTPIPTSKEPESLDTTTQKATPNSATPNPLPSTTSSSSSASSASSSVSSSTISPTPSASGNAASTTSTIESSPARGSDAKHISSGDAAGIGIGSAIGGALIAALLVWLLMRKSHKRERRSRGTTSANGFMGKGRHSQAPIDPESTTLEFDDLSASAVVERALPQPPDDHTVGGEMSKLRTLIKNHVQSYYHNGLLKSTSTDIGRAVTEVAAESMPISASTLTSLLANPRTRMPALRFYLAWTVIQRLEPTCDLGRSFLPPEVAGCLKAMATKEELTPTRMAFLSKWRSISAFLLQKNYGQPNFSKDDARIPNISKGLETLDSVLFLYADESRDNQERLLNLEEIIKRAARFGYLLVSQPSLWKFEWDRSTGSALVVFPGLQQVGDDNGQKMRMPRVVGEPEIFRGPAGI